MTFLVTASGHNTHAYATRAEAQAECDLLLTVLGIDCRVTEVRSSADTAAQLVEAYR